ncbi:pyridoxamine 5'-phosphate oxidase [uncultured Succinatimonas sp.]|uniref:pyridoxamine 5'-phosphate oxidase n=1 Tax=uncultured Succinatimonas sp. TaxID=1262973 RepID=UPI0025DFA42E|nr:pyridoxamine 5'-phosphate oxidase [uncultured Succinatimonas sp.]
MINVAPLRRSYTMSGLSREDLTEKPITLFEKWLQAAIDAGLYDPNAMVVSTVNKEGQPHSRIVLLKNYDENSLVFFTNLGSKKAHDIADNPKVSVLFPWYFLERQVIFTGTAKKLPIGDVLKYFHSRPRDSQLGAWASHQSSRISARSILESKFMELKEKFKNGEVPLPSFWGGYRVTFDTVEFWQGRENRLHDRFFYQKDADGNWQEPVRLAP